jgi:hypothetical protein
MYVAAAIGTVVAILPATVAIAAAARRCYVTCHYTCKRSSSDEAVVYCVAMLQKPCRRLKCYRKHYNNDSHYKVL